MNELMSWPAEVSAWAAVATAVILLLGGIIAWFQASETRRLRRAQVRPFVVVDFDVQKVPQFIYMTISNLGSTMARNIRFQFDPPLASSFDNDPKQSRMPAMAELKILAEGIPSLPPGKTISFLFDAALERKETDLPDRYGVRVTYDGEERRRLVGRARRESYEDPILLDLSIYKNLTWIQRRDVHDLHERIKEIGNVLKSWTAAGRGLLRLSPKEVQAREEAFIERMRSESEGSEE